jgi:putative DNA primase/helicase
VLQPGVLTGSEWRITVVPGRDADGTLWTMQTIDDDGTKRFARASRKAGYFHVIGGMQALAESPALVNRGQGR